jgi:hypothetical protein
MRRTAQLIQVSNRSIHLSIIIHPPNAPARYPAGTL